VARGWLSARAIRLHVALVIVVPGCIVAGLWQLDRALSGNTLSWVYTFEWPFFAGYGVYVWRKLMREIVAEAKAGDDEARMIDAGAPEADDAKAGMPRPGPEAGEAKLGDDEARGGDEKADGEEEEEDEELAAYNRYLAELNASGRQKRW